MPRDLQQIWTEITDQTLDGMPSLSPQSPRENRGGYIDIDDFEERSAAMDASPAQEVPESNLRLYPKALTLRDLDACCILEDAAFPPEQRCSREKVSWLPQSLVLAFGGTMVGSTEKFMYMIPCATCPVLLGRES